MTKDTEKSFPTFPLYIYRRRTYLLNTLLFRVSLSASTSTLLGSWRAAILRPTCWRRPGSPSSRYTKLYWDLPAGEGQDHLPAGTASSHLFVHALPFALVSFFHALYFEMYLFCLVCLHQTFVLFHFGLLQICLISLVSLRTALQHTNSK